MSDTFTLQLYTNGSEYDHVDKTLTQIGSDLTCTARGECSILNPEIEVELSSVPAAANYMYIADFARYYFIDEIVSVRTGLYRIRGTVDPLTSFATELRQCSGIVHRAESELAYNTYLDDGAFRAYANPTIRTLAFPSGFSTWEYLLAIAGGS